MSYSWKKFWALLALACTLPLLLPRNGIAAMISCAYALITTAYLMMACNWQAEEGAAERWFGLTGIAAAAYFINWVVWDMIRQQEMMNRLGFY